MDVPNITLVGVGAGPGRQLQSIATAGPAVASLLLGLPGPAGGGRHSSPSAFPTATALRPALTSQLFSQRGRGPPGLGERSRAPPLQRAATVAGMMRVGGVGGGRSLDHGQAWNRLMAGPKPAPHGPAKKSAALPARGEGDVELQADLVLAPLHEEAHPVALTPPPTGNAPPDLRRGRSRARF